MSHRSALAHVAAATAVAELAFTTREGAVDAAVVTPLTDGDEVVIALPYARRALAEALAAAESVALVASDARLTLGRWEPLAAVGRVVVEPDPDGARFRDRLVDEELRKHPPSRLLANSLMDRREHWWFMPRLLCRLVDVRELRPVGRRTDPSEGVLAWSLAGGLGVDTVACVPLGGSGLRVRSLSGEVLAGSGDPACLLRHDYSVPDLERRSTLVERGHLESDALRVTAREGGLALPSAPGLLTRVRSHRAFARACRRELARDRA